MQGLSSPPAELQVAIANASRQDHVPPDLLTGIWRVESGSSFPNPYVNSLGYGGLFGTKDAYGPTQEQANLAASILRNQLVVHHGNIAEALSSYSGGGYTSVPGETTFGSVDVGTNTILTPPTTYGGASVPTPQNASLLSPVTSFLGGLWSAVTSPLDFFKVLWKLITSQNFWIRILLVGGGFVVVLIGIKAVVS